MILTSKYTQEFYDWLDEVSWLLSKDTSVNAAILFYEKHKEEIMKTQKLNLSDRKRAYELLNKIYLSERDEDEDKKPDSNREPGTESVNTMDKLPSNCS